MTTIRAEHERPAADLVQRQFVATGPNQLWAADITDIPRWAGLLYLAVVLDVWSRRIVGWVMQTHLRTSLAGASVGAVAWGDYDSDGDLDILLTG